MSSRNMTARQVDDVASLIRRGAVRWQSKGLALVDGGSDRPYIVHHYGAVWTCTCEHGRRHWLDNRQGICKHIAACEAYCAHCQVNLRDIDASNTCSPCLAELNNTLAPAWARMEMR